jgi:hypothetical protein
MNDPLLVDTLRVGWIISLKFTFETAWFKNKLMVLINNYNFLHLFENKEHVLHNSKQIKYIIK